MWIIQKNNQWYFWSGRTPGRKSSSFSRGRNLRMFVIKHFLYMDTLYLIAYLIPPKREHRTFNVIAPTHMLSAAMIASPQRSSRHSYSVPTAPRSCTHHSNMWFVKRARVYSATHCATLLSPSLISLPALPLPFRWSPWTCYGMAPQAWWQRSGRVRWWWVCGCRGATLSVHSISHMSALPFEPKKMFIARIHSFIFYFLCPSNHLQTADRRYLHISPVCTAILSPTVTENDKSSGCLCNIDYIIKPQILKLPVTYQSHYFVGLIEQHNDYLCFWFNIWFNIFLLFT